MEESGGKWENQNLNPLPLLKKMFKGNSLINLDDKGRLIVPSKFRRLFPEKCKSLYVTLGRDSCLWLYPPLEWIKIESELHSMNSYGKNEAMMLRQILFYADEYLLDSQHRILLPQKILQVVNIKKEILLIGQLDKIELWDPTTFDSYLQSSGISYEDVMEKVMNKRKIPGYSTKN